MGYSEVKICKCGNTEFSYGYTANVNPFAIRFGIVTGHIKETYTCVKCGEKYFVRKEIE